MRNTILLLLLLILFNCADREYPQKFPIIFTTETSVIADGVKFSGSIESIGTGQKITRYGFAYDEAESPTLSSSYTVVNDQPKEGSFSKIVNSDLRKGKVYYVRAFIQTEELVVYGNQESFTSQGSQSPSIKNFNPVSGLDGSEIQIQGKNFSSKLTGNKVLIGSLVCQVVSATDTSLTVKIPSSSIAGDFPISIEVAEQKGISQNSFFIIGSKITALSKLSGRVGDQIVFTGEYFKLSNNLNITFGPAQQWVTNYAIYNVISDNTLECFVPDYPNKTEQIEISSYFNNTTKKFVSPLKFSIINSWTKISETSPLDKFSGYRSAQINNLIYVVGGKTLYEYDLNTKIYTKKTDFPGEYRFYGSAFSYNGLLYYGFGEGAAFQSSNGKYYNDLWAYSPSENKWSLIGISPMAARSRVSPLVINNKAYFGFGWKYGATSTGYSDFWEFDFNTKTWRQITSPLVNKNPGALAFQINNNCYYVGQDYNSTASRAYLWEFNTTTQVWTKKADYPDFLNGETAIPYNDHGIVLSYPNGSSLTLVYEYDPVQDYWIKRQSASARTAAFQFAHFYNKKLLYTAGSQWELSFE